MVFKDSAQVRAGHSARTDYGSGRWPPVHHSGTRSKSITLSCIRMSLNENN